MNGVMSIKQPYIYENGEKVRLASRIEYDNNVKELYFEVDKEYEEYLCFETSDAFLFALIYFAMINGYDIQCEAPITERIYYQLITYFLPVVTESVALFKPIRIMAEVTSIPQIERVGNAVGASVSGGIDSFYTIVEHLRRKEKSFEVTHLFFGNVFGTYVDEKTTRSRFQKMVNINRDIANELNLSFVALYTNVYEFEHSSYPNYHSLKTCSMILALKKLFGIYYYSSTHSITDFHVMTGDTAFYDLLNLQVISDEKLVFFSSGGELSRAQKTAAIAKNKIVQKHLHVCNMRDDNCSMCDKCHRTLITLWALNELDNYREVFSIEKFKQNKDKVLRKTISRNNAFDKEILQLMKQNGVRLSTPVKISGYILKPYEALLKIVRKSRLVRKFYYLLNIDVLRMGREQADYYRYEYIGSSYKREK